MNKRTKRKKKSRNTLTGQRRKHRQLNGLQAPATTAVDRIVGYPPTALQSMSTSASASQQTLQRCNALRGIPQKEVAPKNGRHKIERRKQRADLGTTSIRDCAPSLLGYLFVRSSRGLISLLLSDLVYCGSLWIVTLAHHLPFPRIPFHFYQSKNIKAKQIEANQCNANEGKGKERKCK